MLNFYNGKKCLYIAEYPYTLYQMIIMSILQEGQNDIIISNGIVDLQQMYTSIQSSNIFTKVYFFNCDEYKKYYELLLFRQTNKLKRLNVLKNQIKTILLQKRIKNITIKENINFLCYDEIIVTDQCSILNGYLAANKIKFTMMEHAKNVFTYLSHLANMFAILINFADKLNIIQGIRTSTKYCVSIIVNKNINIPSSIKHKKIIEWNIDEAISKLSKDQKDKVFQVYSTAYNCKLDFEKEYNVLLTNPLYNDSFVPTLKNQIEFYKDVIVNYFGDEQSVLIKPHPRDTLDYKKYFPNCTVVDNAISAEVLNFSKNLKINKVLTLCSSSISSYNDKAKEVICLEPDTIEANKMKSLEKYRK